MAQKSVSVGAPKRKWARPSDEQIEADGGHFDEHGWWVTFIRTPKQVAAKMCAAMTVEKRRVNMQKCIKAYTSKQRSINRTKLLRALPPEELRARMIKLSAARPEGMAREIGLSTRGKKNKRNTSGHVGVCWCRTHCKWMAAIVVDSRRKHLGSFDNIEAAIAARKAGELRYWGAVLSD